MPEPTCFVAPTPKPPDHVIVPPTQPVAVNVALSFTHTLVTSLVSTGAIGGVPVFIVTVFDAVDVPQLVVHVDVYVPAPTSFVVPAPKPDDHVIVPVSQPVAINVAFSVPQTVVLFVVITGAVGNGPLVIVTVFDADDVPHEFTQVAVYVPTPTSLVAPVPKPDDHVIVPSVQPVAVNVAFSVPQTVVLFVLITGDTGAGRVVIVIVFEFPLFPQIFSQYAV